jgi:uncharacterized protein YndB with AHSA1/START domain
MSTIVDPLDHDPPRPLLALGQKAGDEPEALRNTSWRCPLDTGSFVEILRLDSHHQPATPLNPIRTPPMSTHTIRLHHVFRAAPEKVYRAFLEGDAMCKWLPPYGFSATMHHLEPKVGGTFRMSFTNFTTRKSHSFGGEFLELVPHERIRYTDKFDDPNLPGIIQVTVTLKPVVFGTELKVVQEGVPAIIPAEACYLGWQESLAQLAKLVEPDIQQ